MPDTDIIVSQLPSAVQDNSSDLVMLTQPNAQAETGYSTAKETLENIAKKSVHGIEYETLLANFPSGKRNPTDALNVLNDFIQSQLPVNTASGSLATFSTSLELPLVAMSADIVAQQASGTPTPSSPLPISGVSSVSLTHTGKNLCPILASQTINGVQVVASSDGTLTFNRVSTSNLSSDFTINVSLPNEQYVISANNTSIPPEGSVRTNTFFRPYDGNGTSIAVRTFDTLNKTYSFTNSVSKIMIRIDKDFNESNFVLKMQLEKGSTATAYEAYNGETKTIALGQTVYGGVLDAKSGKLTITHDFKILDGSSDENWFISSTNAYYTFEIGVNSMVADTVISNLFESIQGAPSSDHLGINNSPRYIRVRPSADAMDLQAFKTWLSNNNLQVCYELATPIEITGLTPANFTTIAGANNIFADCGEVSVSFKQGIQEYIDAKIAETQALILNS